MILRRLSPTQVGVAVNVWDDVFVVVIVFVSVDVIVSVNVSVSVDVMVSVSVSVSVGVPLGVSVGVSVSVSENTKTGSEHSKRAINSFFIWRSPFLYSYFSLYHRLAETLI